MRPSYPHRLRSATGGGTSAVRRACVLFCITAEMARAQRLDPFQDLLDAAPVPPVPATDATLPRPRYDWDDSVVDATAYGSTTSLYVTKGEVRTPGSFGVQKRAGRLFPAPSTQPSKPHRSHTSEVDPEAARHFSVQPAATAARPAPSPQPSSQLDWTDGVQATLERAVDAPVRISGLPPQPRIDWPDSGAQWITAWAPAPPAAPSARDQKERPAA